MKTIRSSQKKGTEMTIEISVWYFVEVILACIFCLKVGYDYGKQSVMSELYKERRQNKRIARRNRELTETLRETVKYVK